MRTLGEYWRRFWFEPLPAAPLGIFRLAFYSVILLNLTIEYLPWLRVFYTEHAVFSTSSIYAHYWKSQPVFDLLLLIPAGDSYVYGFFAVTWLAALFSAIGLFTRVSTIVFFLCFLTLNNHFPLMAHAGDNFARLVSLFMCFAPSQICFSLDAWRAGKTGAVKKTYAMCEPVAMRLIQVQLCFVYLINWIYKMAGDVWNDGTAVYYATRLLHLARFSPPDLIDNPLGIKIATWTTLLIELALVVALWPRKTRYYAIVVGVVFHIALDWTFNLGMFEWFFICSYILFVDPRHLEKATLDQLIRVIRHLTGSTASATAGKESA